MSNTPPEFISKLKLPYIITGSTQLPPVNRHIYDGTIQVTYDSVQQAVRITNSPLHINHSYISGTLASNLKNLTGSADNPTMVVQGMSSSLDGAEGLFFYVSGSTATIDDALVFGNPSLTGRWFRLYDTGGPFSAGWWGPITTAAKITNAISAAHVLGGGTVLVPQNSYSFTGVGSDRINLYSNVNLEFAPGTTIAVADPGASISKIINIDSINADMRNIKVFGNGLTINFTRSNNYVLQQGIVINSQFTYRTVDNIEINDIKIVSSSMDGVNVGGNAGCTHSNIRFNRIIASSCKRAGGTLIGSADVIFTDCHFLNNGKGNEPQNGFDIEVNSGLSNLNAKFIRCSFNYNTSHGMYGQNPIYGITSRVVFDGCDFSYNGQNLSSSYGIITGIPNTSLTNCTARKNSGGGIYVSAEATLQGCTARDNTGVGITGIASIGPINITSCIAKFNSSDGFRLNTFGTSTATSAINNSEALGNRVCGITLTSARNAKVIGNTVLANREDGIKIVTSEQNTICNNTISSNGQASDNAADNIIVQTRSHLNSFFGNHIRQSPKFYDTYASASTFTTGNNVQFSGSQYNTENGVYNGMYARVVAGTQNGAGGIVTAFTGSTGIATINWSPTLGGALDATSRIQLVGTRVFYGAVQSGSTTGVQLSTELASQLDSAYCSGTLHVYSGTTISQSATITAYNGSTGFVTVSGSLGAAPAVNTVVEIWFYNRPRYGIRLDTTSHQNTVIGNDFYLAGANTAYSSGVTTTNTTTLNRLS